MGYQNTYDLMDEAVFPRDSIYLVKENPKFAVSQSIARFAKTDEEIIASVSQDMAGTLGAELEP